MRLIDLMSKANEGYPDGVLAEYYDENTGEPRGWQSGDILAWFVANELAEDFDPEASDVEQIERAEALLRDAIHDLQDTIDALTADRRRWRYCTNVTFREGKRAICPHGLDCLGCADFSDVRESATTN